MIGKMNSLGDRLLELLLPSTRADAAALCRGRYMGYWSGCEHYCYRNGDRTTKYKWCNRTSGCQIECYDCCN
ncbi:hypothetical protein [Streptosporangium sp. NPDC023615]|uniref:hypothetical protein n=1 Tax=Streptosporangium sp. NPDC023615 TaxID=3154794 RepID=UPI003423A3A3